MHKIPKAHSSSRVENKLTNEKDWLITCFNLSTIGKKIENAKQQHTIVYQKKPKYIENWRLKWFIVYLDN